MLITDAKSQSDEPSRYADKGSQAEIRGFLTLDVQIVQCLCIGWDYQDS